MRDRAAVARHRILVVAEALDEGSIDPLSVSHLHAAVAELDQMRLLLEQLGGPGAGPVGTSTVDGHLRAAELAMAAGDHDVAVDRYAEGVRASEDDAPDADADRLEALLGLGHARWRADDRVAAEATFAEAAVLARRIGSAEGLARAVLRGGIEYYFSGDRAAGLAVECREALDGLPPGDSALRARLLAELAAKLVGPPDAAAGRRLARQALAMARRVDDPFAIGTALVAEQVTDLGPATAVRRRAGAEEILVLARQARDPSLLVHGRFLLMGALLELGDIRGLDVALADQDRLLDGVGDPNLERFALWVQATRALLQGRPAVAEQLALESDALSAQFDDPDRIAVLGGQLGVARWMQGRLLDLEPLFEDQLRATPDDPLWSAVLAYIWSADDRLDAARGALARLGDLADVPSGMHWLLTTVTAAEAAIRVGKTALVADAREALLPYVDRFVPIAMGAAGWGTVARPLGLAALHLGNVDEGLAHLEHAVAVGARLGARPWLVEAQLDLAEALLRHGRGDDPRLVGLVDEAARTAEQLGLDRFRERAAALRGVRPAARTGPLPAARSKARVAVLGAFEVSTVDGRRAEWTSRKARQLLKVLVARRGVPSHREELMGLLWPDVDPDALRNRFSVGLSVIRRTLDPERAGVDPIDADSESVCLRIDEVDVDVEEYLVGARRALDAHAADHPDARRALVEALQLHRGPALPDEPYAEWAVPLQREVRSRHLQLARALGDRAAAIGDHLAAADAFHRLVEADPFDERAHLLLLGSLDHIGAAKQAERERRRFNDALDGTTDLAAG